MPALKNNFEKREALGYMVTDSFGRHFDFYTDAEAAAEAVAVACGEIRTVYRPMVGDFVTMRGWSELYPFEVIEVSPSGKRVKVRRMRAEALHSPEDLGFTPGGFVGHHATQDRQDWRITPDSEGATAIVTLRKNGRWYLQGDSIKSSCKPWDMTRGQYFYDFNF